MSHDPLRRELKTTHLPSGENDALASRSGCDKNGFAFEPSASAITMSLSRGAKLANASSYCGLDGAALAVANDVQTSKMHRATFFGKHCMTVPSSSIAGVDS